MGKKNTLHPIVFQFMNVNGDPVTLPLFSFSVFDVGSTEYFWAQDTYSAFNCADAKGFAVRLGTMITWCMQVIIKSLRLDGESAGPPIPMSIVSRMSTTR